MQTTKESRKRDLTLDGIRAAAVLLVLAVHFFLNSGFYEMPVAGAGMELGVLIRTQFMVCVPLFLLLTGYLQKEKTWSWHYYRGLGKLILTYVLVSVLCSVYRAAVLAGPWSPKEWLRGILGFYGAPYSWYMELYFGLFLLLPFLNLIWRGLPSRRAREVLVLTTVFLSVCPSLNYLSRHFGWQIALDRWDQLYPVAYYFTGCYLREYSVRIRSWLLAVIDLLAVLLGGGLHLYQIGGETMGFLPITHWNGAFVYVAAVSLFLLLKNLRLAGAPRVVKRGIYLIASLSLPIFLVSWIPDTVVYGLLNGRVAVVPQRLPWLPVAVLSVLIASVILAFLIQLAERLIRRGAVRGIQRLRGRGQ